MRCRHDPELSVDDPLFHLELEKSVVTAPLRLHLVVTSRSEITEPLANAKIGVASESVVAFNQAILAV